MTINEYIESFGWEMKDCTPEEIQEARKELEAIERGEIVMDGVLFWKTRIDSVT